MALGGFFSSDSEATQNQSAADNEARQATGGSNQANEGSVVIAASKGTGLYSAPSSTLVSGSNLTDSSRQALLTDSARAESITINNTDAALIEGLAGKFVEANRQQGEALAGILAATKQADEQKAKEASGEKWWNKINWRAVGVGAVVVGLLVWLWKGK